MERFLKTAQAGVQMLLVTTRTFTSTFYVHVDPTTGAAALAAATTETTMTAGAEITLPAVKDEEGEMPLVNFLADAAGVAMT